LSRSTHLTASDWWRLVTAVNCGLARAILRFGFALGHDECGKLDERLATQRFEKGGAREQKMTYSQATAFVRTALDLTPA
jgi:hypothetical protein